MFEGGLARFVKLDKTQRFNGKAALMNEMQQGSAKCFVTLIVDAGDCDAPYVNALEERRDCRGNHLRRMGVPRKRQHRVWHAAQ